MKCRFTYKHMETSPSLSAYAEEKVLQKVERFSTKPIDVHVIFSVDGLEHHTQVNVSGGDGFNFAVDSRSGDMYSSVDLVVDKLWSQLKKHKDKLKNHKYKDNIRHLVPQEPFDREDSDSVPVDAQDVIKYEKARLRKTG